MNGEPTPAAASRGPWAWWGVVAATLLIGAFCGGVLGAGSQIGPGTTEQAQGADVGEAGPTYWVWAATQLDVVPTPVPGAVSTAVAAPTLLPTASTSYRIDAATAGNTSVRWEFTEETTAPKSTELELRFTAGLSKTAAHITVYFETRPTAPTAALIFYAYWDAGAFSPASLSIETMQVDVLVCTAIGVCP